MAKLKEMKCPSESTESLTTRLKVFISSSVDMTIDPGTSSVVASSSCLVELFLAIVWAVYTWFSRFLVVASVFWNHIVLKETSSSSVWIFSTLTPVWFIFAMLVWFSLARTVVWLSSLVSAFYFFLQCVFSYFWVWGVSSNFLKILI